jgi:hypothetical protein
MSTLFSVANGDNDYYFLGGAGSLEFDFAAGSVTGALNVDKYDFGREGPLGVFTLMGTITRAGDITFRGTIIAPGAAERGTFEGRFAGPDASEIILRWRTPAVDPSTSRPLTAYGAFAGRMR